MFATKCTYVFAGTEKMAKDVLFRIKNDPCTLRAKLVKTETGWKIPCIFIGKGIPLALRSLIKRV